MEPGHDWAPVLSVGELPEGKPVRATLDGTEVLLYRTGDRVLAISDRCTHQGAPLHRGRVTGTGENLMVTCPIHGSVFRLGDGRVLRGPATRPVAVYEARIQGDDVEVRRLPGPA